MYNFYSYVNCLMDISGCLIKVMCSGNSVLVCCVNMSILCDIMYRCYMYMCIIVCVACIFVDYLFCYSQSLIVSRVLSFLQKSLSLSVLKPVGMGESVFIDELLSLWSLWPFYVRSFWIIVRFRSNGCRSDVRLLPSGPHLGSVLAGGSQVILQVCSFSC